MKPIVNLLYVLSCIFILSGCVTTPTEADLQNADYGSYPDNYNQIIKNYLNNTLKDPYSVQIEKISGPKKQWSSYFSRVQYGYAVCYSINAKNSYGAYIGTKPHFFLIRNGNIIQHIYGKGGDYDLGAQAASQRCG